MILSATRADAARSRRHYVSPHGAHSDVETYMGMNKALLGNAQVDPAVADPAIRSPNAYLVSQAETIIEQVDEFSVRLINALVDRPDVRLGHR